jgi:hypothetical protein
MHRERLMPNVRGDKRRTIVCPDDLWDGLGEYAAERSTTRGAVIRDQIRALTTPLDTRVCTCTFDCTQTPAVRDTTGCEVHGVTGSGEEPADAADV